MIRSLPEPSRTAACCARALAMGAVGDQPGATARGAVMEATAPALVGSGACFAQASRSALPTNNNTLLQTSRGNGITGTPRREDRSVLYTRWRPPRSDSSARGEGDGAHRRAARGPPGAGGRAA